MTEFEVRTILGEVLRDIIRAELAPVLRRLDAIEGRLGGQAVLVPAAHLKRIPHQNGDGPVVMYGVWTDPIPLGQATTTITLIGTAGEGE